MPGFPAQLNEALAHCQAVGKYLGYNQLSSRLTKLKESVQWLREVSSVALQQSLRHLEDAYQKFFNKEGGAPRYKKRKTNQSATLMSNAFSLQGKGVYLAKIGVVKPYLESRTPKPTKLCYRHQRQCGAVFSEFCRGGRTGEN